MASTASPPGPAALDSLSVVAATTLLEPVCASARWLAGVVEARPYGDLPELIAASDRLLDGLTWPDIEQALAAHPRIGDRAAGEHREAAWSRQEQSAAAAGEADVLAELKVANAAYEDRFGWVFLICAAGRPAGEILAAARARLANDHLTEQDVVRAELRDIVRLRLGKVFGPGAPTAEAPAGTSLSTHVLDAVTGRPAVGMAVGLECRAGADWVPKARAVTDADGRIAAVATGLDVGDCRLVFDTRSWSGQGDLAFYPEVVITFRVTADDRHLHIPLLLSPFSYSTYRGS